MIAGEIRRKTAVSTRDDISLVCQRYLSIFLGCVHLFAMIKLEWPLGKEGEEGLLLGISGNDFDVNGIRAVYVWFLVKIILAYTLQIV